MIKHARACKRAAPECHMCGNVVCCGCLALKDCCDPCQRRRKGVRWYRRGEVRRK